MAPPTLELADIFRQYGPAYRQAHSLPLHQHRLMRAIETCRTPALGGIVEWCDHCQYTHTRYRSCRNRHCPKCQGAAREKWLEQRRAELLPTEYFHVVFTLPEPIAAIAFYNQEVVYSLLFRATAETLLTIAGDPERLGVETGFFAVLHTWGQNLHFHPHLHCVVPGGGLSPDHNQWIGGRRRFFLPVKVLSSLFRRLFLEGLEEAYAAGKLQFFGDLEPLRDPPAFARYLAPWKDKDWVVYAKAPFGGPQQVLEYLGRYTHRVAISNRRLLQLEEGQVSFQWKDYRDANRSKVMTVSAEEFIRRFLQHALPPGFQRIRYYGFLANCHRAAKLDLCRKLLATVCSLLLPQPADCRDFLAALTAGNLRLCPQCGIGALLQRQIFPLIPVVSRLRADPRGQLMMPSGWNPQSRQRCLPGRVRSTCVPHCPHNAGTPFPTSSSSSSLLSLPTASPHCLAKHLPSHTPEAPHLFPAAQTPSLAAEQTPLKTGLGFTV